MSDEPEATLPPISERRTDGSQIALHRPLGVQDLVDAVTTIVLDAFQRADRGVAIQIGKDVYHAGTALTVMHQLADALSHGDATLRERLIPTLTEDAARVKAASDFAAPLGEIIAAVANVLQVIEGHAELGRPLDLQRLRASSNYQWLATRTRELQQGAG